MPTSSNRQPLGGFISVSGIAGVSRVNIETALHCFAERRGGRLARDETGLLFPDAIVITTGKPARFSIMYPPGISECNRVARFLSKTLKAPVFLFHIHDGDFWMYTLFVNGRLLDRFNPMPDYWRDDVSSHERKLWSGNAQKLARQWPDLTSRAIERYLVSWKRAPINPGKAYPDDMYAYNDCSQLIDFMRRLGLRFPIADDGAVVGKHYWFDLPTSTSSTA